MKQRVQQDRPEGGGTNPAQRKAAQRQREIAGAQHQGHRHHDQIAVLAEVDAVLHPDPRPGDGDQAKDHDRGAADHRPGNGVD